ncbi:hypothetical protein [Nostoc sp.]
MGEKSQAAAYEKSVDNSAATLACGNPFVERENLKANPQDAEA